MNLLQALFLGILQGATEFLPVSSSGHLVLAPWLLGWSSPGLAFDTVVHWGTALAVVVYFWRDWVALARSALGSIVSTGRSITRENPSAGQDAPPARTEQERADARLAWLILLGTIPAATIGYLLEDFFEQMFSRPAAAAGFLLVTAALLTGSEYLGRRARDLDSLTWTDALVVGLAQALAIFPGISRSGATIAAGLMQGLRRESAARFSFLLATPIILGAGLFKLIELAQVGDLAMQAPILIVGFVTASAVGFVCIHLLLRYLQHRRLYPFAIYCAAAGLACLVVALVRK